MMAINQTFDRWNRRQRAVLWVIAQATEHKQWEETKTQEPKPEYKTKDNQKLFFQQ
jgi:hypothetical protein